MFFPILLLFWEARGGFFPYLLQLRFWQITPMAHRELRKRSRTCLYDSPPIVSTQQNKRRKVQQSISIPLEVTDLPLLIVSGIEGLLAIVDGLTCNHFPLPVDAHPACVISSEGAIVWLDKATHQLFLLSSPELISNPFVPFSAKAKVVASQGLTTVILLETGEISLWDLHTCKFMRHLEPALEAGYPLHICSLDLVAIHECNARDQIKQLVIGTSCDGRIVIWDVVTGKHLATQSTSRLVPGTNEIVHLKGGVSGRAASAALNEMFLWRFEILISAFLMI